MDEPSFIIDINPDHKDNIILTEQSTFGKAPIELSIKTRKDIHSGSHATAFVFTYFNGETWATESMTYDFIVLSWYERNQLKIWIYGILVTLVLFLISLIADHHGIFERGTAPVSQHALNCLRESK